jgi:multisite-specific tRNA:(cytosine-C5)-methyltransferase
MTTDFEIVDVSSQLPDLIRRPGLTAWRPTADKRVSRTFGTYKEFVESSNDQIEAESKMTPGHWPPSNARELHLERWCDG